MTSLPEGAAHLWLAFPDAIDDPGLLARLEGLLDDGERARHRRRRLEPDRRLFLVAHALQRSVLARYTGVPAAALRFVPGAHGRPGLAPPTDGLSFNLSHTRGLAVCAIARGGEVGLDVEAPRAIGNLAGLAARTLAPAELATVLGLPEPERLDAFLTRWTLKEACLKALGTGIAAPLRSLSFAIAEDGAVAVSFTPPLEGDPAHWRFAVARPTPEHRLAVALRSSAPPPAAIAEVCTWRPAEEDGAS